MRRLVALLAFFGVAALGADVNGTWKASAEGPNGTIERTFVFKVDGTKLTGETVSSFMGKSQIMDGKVNSEAVSFSITVKFQDNEVKVDYKGKVTGNEIHLTSSFGDSGQTMEWNGKRVE